MKIAARLLGRLALALVAVSAATDAVLWLFARRWLLLDDDTAAGVSPLALACMGFALVLDISALLALFLPLRRLLRALGGGAEQVVEATDLLKLYSLPSRLAVAHACLAVAVALLAQLDALRPAEVDPTTLAALAILSLTLASTASLPLYVTARSSVAAALERAPSPVARDAVSMVAGGGRQVARVRLRFLAAVAAPVSLVAIGASLLVFAHARSFETRARCDDARAVAAGTLDMVSGSAAGRVDALIRAMSMGLHVEFEAEGQRAAASFDPGGTVAAPLEDGRAVVQIAPASPGAATATGAAVSLAAVVLAALIGRRIGGGLSRDVAAASAEIEAMGALDVLRGSPVIAGARFDAVQALARAIDRLSGVFREFAAAQERAIVARSQMERTRSMFLASMSHDLRSPLNAILGFAALAAQNPQLSPAQLESLTIIEQRGRELLVLIQTVLDSARAEAGQLRLVRELAEPEAIVAQAVREARDNLAGMAVEILGEAQDDAAPVLVDGRRLIQAIVAITTSAARACERGIIRVRVTTTREALRVEVSVEGAAPLGAAKMAEALDSPERARRLGSLGLGVMLARAIVGLHSGVVSFDATVPAIAVTLPLRREGGAGAFSV